MFSCEFCKIFKNTFSIEHRNITQAFCKNKYVDCQYRSSHSQMFFKIDSLKNFANFTGKHTFWSLFLVKLQVCNFFKNRFKHTCFPVKFAKSLRTPFFIEHPLWLLLSVVITRINPLKYVSNIFSKFHKKTYKMELFY